MNKCIKIGNSIVSENTPAFVIGELSCNHQNDYDIAIRTIDAMIASGVDCVKLQTSRRTKSPLTVIKKISVSREARFGTE